MPDFKLRPEKECGPYDEGFVFNNGHEQGARTLAEAVIEDMDAKLRAYQDVGRDDMAWLIQDCINDIHRLVPPKDQAQQPDAGEGEK